MFQKIADYTELLLPDNLLREGSVIQQMIELIPEEDWKDAVQIIGWLYQFYNIEPKAAALAKDEKLVRKKSQQQQNSLRQIGLFIIWLRTAWDVYGRTDILMLN